MIVFITRNYLAPLRRIERRIREFGPRRTLGFEAPGLATKTRGVYNWSRANRSRT